VGDWVVVDEGVGIGGGLLLLLLLLVLVLVLVLVLLVLPSIRGIARLSIPSMSIKTRRRTPKRSTTSTQARRWPGAGI
jgi:uncharacterized protein HemY